jgi:hypothetical protein
MHLISYWGRGKGRRWELTDAMMCQQFLVFSERAYKIFLALCRELFIVYAIFLFIYKLKVTAMPQKKFFLFANVKREQSQKAWIERERGEFAFLSKPRVCQCQFFQAQGVPVPILSSPESASANAVNIQSCVPAASIQ